VLISLEAACSWQSNGTCYIILINDEQEIAHCITTVTRHASRAIALTNFHKLATTNEFAISPRYRIVEIAANLAALSSAYLHQFAELF
jgi:hypothetical protein